MISEFRKAYISKLLLNSKQITLIFTISAHKFGEFPSNWSWPSTSRLELTNLASVSYWLPNLHVSFSLNYEFQSNTFCLFVFSNDPNHVDKLVNFKCLKNLLAVTISSILKSLSLFFLLKYIWYITL